MKRLLLLALALLLLAAPAAAQKSAPTLFVRTIVKKTPFIKGDSTLVSFVLYSDAEFQKVVCKTKKLKIKRGSLRKLDVNRARSGGRARYQNRIYNTLIWSQYMVASDDVGKIVVPPLEFECVLRVYQQSNDPFDRFFNRRRSYKDVEMKTKSEETTIEVIEKPRKNTNELLKSGGKVI